MNSGPNSPGDNGSTISAPDSSTESATALTSATSNQNDAPRPKGWEAAAVVSVVVLMAKIHRVRV